MSLMRLLSILPVLLGMALGACSSTGARTPTPRYDLVIRNARIVDGSGKPAFAGDLAVKDGLIARLGAVEPRSAAREIDARGLIIAPGFIDVHTHVDADIHKQPAAENFVRDGVTTIVTGNCGYSVLDVRQYLERIDREGAGLNVSTLIGHNTVLRSAKGDTAEPLTAHQMQKAKDLVERAMRGGAVGMSTGLIYNPGQFSPLSEIVELQTVAARHGGVYATHMRSEGSGILKAIDEALTIGKSAGCRVQISHFKLPADASRALSTGGLGTDVTLQKVLDARAAGMDVWLDQYPYTASSTSINTLIPDEFLKGGIEAGRKRVADDPSERSMLLTAMLELHGKQRRRTHFGYVAIASCAAYPHYNGRNVWEITRTNKLKQERGGDVELLGLTPDQLPEATLEEQCRTIIDIFANGGASCVFHTMAEEDVENILRNPIVAVASDSGVRKFGEGVPHPRGYGSNARVLGHYARERGLMSMEEAVRRMTSLPAYVFSLPGRGLIKQGFAADLVIFDPHTVIDTATFEKPHQYPIGIPTVIVNGQPVLLDGKMTGALPGRAIRRKPLP